MRDQRPARRMNQKGILLISSYLLVGVLLVFSNIMGLRSLGQRLANDQLRNRLQSADLAQAAVEALREELYQFVTSDVYEDTYSSDPRRALQWLDSLDDPVLPAGMLAFDPNPHNNAPPNNATREGTFSRPLCIASLPTIQGAKTTTPQTVCSTVGSGKTTVTTCQVVQVATPQEEACKNDTAEDQITLPHAWVTKVEDLGEDANGNGLPDPGEDLDNDGWESPGPGGLNFNPRRVTIRAATKINDLRRSVQAAYIFSLNASSIFRYGYFINNFGWLQPIGASKWHVNGDIRSNGDLLFSPGASVNLLLQGDAYASVNPDLKNPLTLMPAQGTITGTAGYISDHEAYFNQKSKAGRPNRLLTLPGRPFLNAPYGNWLPSGWGWDTLGADQYAPHYFPAQREHDLPSIGDLTFYKQRAQAENSRLTGRNQFGKLQTISQVYGGPDGNVSTVADNAAPLVLIGTASDPIVIDGPVVVPGDVIIRGVVRGQGAIYAGRNIHIVGQLTYQTPWSMPRLQRNVSTGKLVVDARDRLDSWGGWVGTVCDDGRYVAPGVALPAGCVAPGQASVSVPYGYAMPGDARMGFPSVPEFTARYQPPVVANSLGLSAKGNIVIGDYASAGFQNNVMPRLQGIAQDYVIDISDAALGYHSYNNLQGAPMFNGKYTRPDGGVKTDGTPRKFYESSLDNTALHQTTGVWQPIVNPSDPLYSTTAKAQIDAVLYANHLVAGYVPDKGASRFELNGALIARDDGLVIASNFALNHDNRLNMGDPTINGSAWLPVTISRPVLSRWQECPAAGCP